MMPIKLLAGAPVTGNEARFLRALGRDLAGTDALVLANFELEGEQIDFVVVTKSNAALLELKNYETPVFGNTNGAWSYDNFAGQRIRSDRRNPYQQALKQKFALSDAMLSFQRERSVIPEPLRKGFYSQFQAFVCVAPRIHPDSRVTSGDFKARVLSYADVLKELRLGETESSWTQAHWVEFATEQLHLTDISIAAATDSAMCNALEAIRGYRSRVQGLIGLSLPPLIEGPDGLAYGSNLVATTSEPHNVILLGPTGSSKTHHLKHITLALAQCEGEIPIYVEAKTFSGQSMHDLIAAAVAPFYRGSTEQLLRDASRCGVRPVLILDALNECPEEMRRHLIHEVSSLVVEFGARLVLSSRFEVELPPALGGQIHHLPLPGHAQKRAIFSHHAQVEPSAQMDSFCEQFSNAYELTVAGRCYGSGRQPQSAAELYARYVHRQLPKQGAIANALLAEVATKMNAMFQVAWPRHDFIRTATSFLNEQHAPLQVLEDLRNTRLVKLDEHFFTFEHELLLDHFRAEGLWNSAPTPRQLATELRRPRNHQLFESVLSRSRDREELSALLNVAPDASTLSRILRGHCGPLAQSALIESCLSLLREARSDLANVGVQLQFAPAANGDIAVAGIELTGARNWTDYDSQLCRAIAHNLDNDRIRAGFLELLDQTEAQLRVRAEAAATQANVRASIVWGEVVHQYGGVLGRGRLTLPCQEILWSLRSRLMSSAIENLTASGPPVKSPTPRPDLLKRVDASGLASDFSLLALLQDAASAADDEGIEGNLELVGRGLSSGIYIIQVSALSFVEQMRAAVDRTCPEQIPAIRKMIESTASANILLNSAVFEALATFDGIESSVSAQDATSEMRSIIGYDVDDPEVIAFAETLELAPGAALCELAAGSLNKIWDDHLFEGAYNEAYFTLSSGEKERILVLASHAENMGSTIDWVLDELLRHGSPRAIPVFERFAGRIDGNTCFVQDAVSAFVSAVIGCARWLDEPSTYNAIGSPEHEAWGVIGRIIFWDEKGPAVEHAPSRIEEAWAYLLDDLPLEAGDALYHISQIRRPRATDLVADFPGHADAIARTCLSQPGLLPSIFQTSEFSDRPSVPMTVRHSLSEKLV